MSERYYYLLDNQAHGPFSRIAVENLIGGRLIEGALFRSRPEDPWLTAEEIELPFKSESLANVGPTPLSAANPDLHSRSRHAMRPDSPSKNAESLKRRSLTAPLLLFCILLGVGGVAWMLMGQKADVGASAIGNKSAVQNPADEGVGTVIAAETRKVDVSAKSDPLTVSGTYLYGFEECGDSPLDCEKLWLKLDTESQTKHQLLRTESLHDNGGEVEDRYLIVTNYKDAITEAGLPLVDEQHHPGCLLEGKATFVIAQPRMEPVTYWNPELGGETPAPKVAMSDLVSVISMELPSGEKSLANCERKNSASPEVISKPVSSSNLDQNVLRFDSARHVLEAVRRMGSEDWNPDGMRECDCVIKGNVIELSVDTRFVLYNDAEGPSVVAYYWEDNRGNPYTHFYRYDGEWQDVGAKVMPGYTGKHDDYFEATPDGVTKWRGEKPQLKYIYRSGSFRLVD